MRYLVVVFLLLTTMLVVSGCCVGSCNAPAWYKHVNASPVYRADDGKLYMLKHKDWATEEWEGKHAMRPELEEVLYVFNENQKKWLELARVDNAKFTILKEEYDLAAVQAIYNVVSALRGNAVNTEQYIVIKGNIATLKNNVTDLIVTTTLLPTANEISAATGIAITVQPFYYVLRNKQLDWNEEYIVAVCDGHFRPGDSGTPEYCLDYHYFHLYKNQQGWQIVKVGSLSDHRGVRRDVHGTTEYNYREVYNDVYIATTYRALDGKITLCSIFHEHYDVIFGNQGSERICFVKTNEFIEFKPLFGIYAEGFEEIFRKNHSPYNIQDVAFDGVTFDENGNMHVFYNKQADINSFNYDYFYWAYYDKENPTVPLYQQKIPWYKK